MEKYIEGNKAAWEEAFENRDPSWGADISERLTDEEYPFFNEETAAVLRTIETEGKVIGQFCCNNVRELLSLVKSGRASRGVGFDIAENQVAFANKKAKDLQLPCEFVAVNIYDIDDRYKETFDVVIIPAYSDSTVYKELFFFCFLRIRNTIHAPITTPIVFKIKSSTSVCLPSKKS